MRPRDDDDGDASAVRVRQRVCVMAVEVVRVQKRVRDGDDDEASRGRVVRVRRGVEAGGASTPHQDGGGGILSARSRLNRLIFMNSDSNSVILTYS